MGDRRKCQTFAASPAEPGGLPVMLGRPLDPRHRHRRTSAFRRRYGDRTAVHSVAILDPMNVPTPSVPEALTPDITSWSEIDGLVRVSVVIGPWGREGCAKDRPCRQAADDWSDGKATMPSGVRCRRARNRTDCDCRAKRECGQGFFHHTISTSSYRKNSHVRYLTSFGRSTPQRHDCKSPARSRHWRSSTIGWSLSKELVDKSHPGIDCYHGQLRFVLSVTGLDRPSIPIGGDFKRRDP